VELETVCFYLQCVNVKTGEVYRIAKRKSNLYSSSVSTVNMAVVRTWEVGA